MVNKLKYNNNKIIIIGIFLIISFMTIGYSALNTHLSISGIANVRPKGKLFISSIKLYEAIGATEIYNPTITDSTTNISMKLDNSNSTFTYEITLTNTTDDHYYLSRINELTNNGNGIYFLMNLYLFDDIAPNGETIFHLVYEGNSPEEVILNLEYIFETGERYRDPILNGADPSLIDGLIPIVYNEDIKEWVKADVINQTWYDYESLKWANATSVIESERKRYVEAEPGTTVYMEHMTSMMVWIPRHSYTLKEIYGYSSFGGDPPSILTPGAFDIKFGDSKMLDTGSAKYTTGYPTNFYTSSAFCWGNTCDNPTTRTDKTNLEIDGFWIAKFEASKVGDILYSKPNMSPMTNISIAATFNYVQSLMNGVNGYDNYGLVGYVDAHLIKNTEWGAMAYLSQSKYGKYGNNDYIGVNKEIYPNNCTNYTTGIGGDNPQAKNTDATCLVNTYDTYFGMGASTTGNIYGVYDTVGGTFDRVMGTVLSGTGSFYPDKSGFTSMPSGRYINVYKAGNYGVNTTPSIKGDALTDTLGFYQDRGVTSEYLVNSWFYRGGSLWAGITEINGIFSYTTYSGIADPNHSSRYTITIYH